KMANAINFGFLLKFILFLFAIWKAVPIIYYLINPKFLGYKLLADNINLNNSSKEISHIFNKFESLGFKKLCIKEEKLPLWGTKIISFEFTNEELRTFGAIFKYKDKFNWYFYTPFVNGGVVLTANTLFPTIE